MSASPTACAACCAWNRPQQLWCFKCDAPLPEPTLATVVGGDQESDARVRLYRDVIADLSTLRNEPQADTAQLDAVGLFFESRLEGIEKERVARQHTRAVIALSSNARRAAHSNQLGQAVALLNQAIGIADSPETLHDAIAEIESKRTAEQQEREEQELACRKKVKALRDEASQLIALSRLDEAKQKLLVAKELDPGDTQIMAILATVNTRLSMLQQREKTREKWTRQWGATVSQSARARQRESAPPPQTAPVQSPPVQSSPVQSPPVHKQPSVVHRSPQAASFDDRAERVPSPAERLIESTSKWSSVVKPFLLDNVGWFVGAFLVVAGFVVLIASFWTSIAPNRVMVHSLVYLCLLGATTGFFALAYFMRRKYAQLERSSNVLLAIVALLIPLVFAAAVLTSLVPSASADAAEVPAKEMSALKIQG